MAKKDNNQIDNFFDVETGVAINAQEMKKAALGLDSTVSTTKAHLHITITRDAMEKLKTTAKEKGVSMGVLVQLLINENL